MDHSQPQLSIEAINLIKYSVLVDGVSLSLLSNNFVTKYNQPIFPPGVLVSHIIRHYACNIRRSLRSHQRSSTGRSSYQPLPPDYNPYSYIRAKRGSEHIILPPFTNQIWKSQFSQGNSNDSTRMRPTRSSLNHFFASNLSPRSSPRHEATHHEISSSSITVEAKQYHGVDLTPVKPQILDCDTVIEGVPVAFHLKVTLNKNGVAFVGFGFNIFAAYVNNAITLKGFKHNALLVGTVHAVPFNNSLPFKELAFIGNNGQRIFVPMVYGMEVGMFDEISDFLCAKKHVTGNEHEQIGTSMNAIREHTAPYAAHHSMIAIEFDNIPNGYKLNRNGLFQSNVTLERKSNALTAHMLSKCFDLHDREIKGHERTYTFNQTSFTYILPLDSPATKVRKHYHG